MFTMMGVTAEQEVLQTGRLKNDFKYVCISKCISLSLLLLLTVPALLLQCQDSSQQPAHHSYAAFRILLTDGKLESL